MQPLFEHRLELAGYRTRALELEGEGPPVLLFHGWADSADTWRLLLDRLGREGRAALALDLPGFGTADKLTDEPILEQLDAFVDAALEHIGEAARSRWATRSAAASRCARPSATTSTASWRWRRPGSTWRAGSCSCGATRWCATCSPRRCPVPNAVTRRVVAERLQPARLPPALGGRPARGQDVRGPSREPGHGRAGGRARPGGCCPSSTTASSSTRSSCPVLLVWGRQDLLVFQSGAERVLDAVPDSRLEVIEDCGHCPQLERPDRLGDLLLDFSGSPGLSLDTLVDSAANGYDMLVGGGLAEPAPTPTSIIDEGPQRTVYRYRPARRGPAPPLTGAAGPAAGRARQLLRPAPRLQRGRAPRRPRPPHLPGRLRPDLLLRPRARPRALGGRRHPRGGEGGVRGRRRRAGPAGGLVPGRDHDPAGRGRRPEAAGVLGGHGGAARSTSPRCACSRPSASSSKLTGGALVTALYKGARRRARAARVARLPPDRGRPLPDQAAVPGPAPGRPRDAGALRGRRQLHGAHAGLPGPHLRPALPRLLPRQRAGRRQGPALRRGRSTSPRCASPC